MRVAILSGNARPADAIGNQIAEKMAFFLERSALVSVFVEDARTLHPAIAHRCQAVSLGCLSAATHECLAASDLVIAEFGHYHSLLELLPTCNRLGRRVLIDYHGITPLELWGDQNREPIAKALRRRGIVWYADAVLVHSRFAENEILADTNFPRERAFVLGHPIDVERFRPDGPVGPWRKRLGLTKDDRLLLFVGRIARSKRIDLLIEALSHLPDQVTLAIAGDAQDIYALEAARCRELAKAKGLAGRVHWLGQVADADLPSLYRAADVFVTASEHEGFCIPVAEALCSGTPVVSSRAGALPETLGAGGLLFTPGDAADLARQLRQIFFDELGATLGERAIAQSASFARSRWRGEFGRLFEQILDMPRRPMGERLQIQAANDIETVSAKQKQALVAVHITNGGSHPVELGDIGATCLQEGSHAAARTSQRSPVRVAPFNNACDLIMPGRTATVSMLVAVPGQPGTYTVTIQIERKLSTAERTAESLAECRIKLNVTENADPLPSALVELSQLCRLPEGSEYASCGRRGRIKAWVKEKLLGGFRRRYVDVLSRQQSTVNGLISAAIIELNAAVGRLQRARDSNSSGSPVSVELLDRVRKLERRVAELEESWHRLQGPCRQEERVMT
jgi:glycosyltransferase involved in cell wall biosynthesis